MNPFPRDGHTHHRVWVYGDHVNTDVIFPGKYTYTLKTPEELAAHALEDLDPRFASAVQAGDVIIGGKNWGCGSSREQAVTALKSAGVHILIAGTFSRIYFRNCINQGVLPIICTGIQAQVHTGDTLEIHWAERLILAGGQTFIMPVLSPSVQAILDAGGLVPMLRARFQANTLTQLQEQA
jgi:3-isopropylmalate/(R)-2-methylmalate dehydratase small subunit